MEGMGSGLVESRGKEDRIGEISSAGKMAAPAARGIFSGSIL